MSQNRYDGLDPYLISQVRYRARHLSQRSAIDGMAIEDIEQELVLAVLLRQPTFDATKASWPTFVDRLLCYQVRCLIKRARTQKRGSQVAMVSFESWRERYPETADAPLFGVLSEAMAAQDISRDVTRIAAKMPPHLALLLVNLQTQSITEISRLTQTPRTTLYDRLAALRAVLREQGFEQYVR